ncbi:hypothetical protein GCK32_019791, partial [Trichostrongylus colubriformis]
AHHLALSLLYIAPCDLFLPKALYIVMNVPTIFVIIAAQFMQFSIIAERWLAITSVNYYETGYRKLGPALITISIVITVCIILVVYYGDSFDEPHLSGRWLSTQNQYRVNAMLTMLLIMNLAALVMTIVLHFRRPKRQIGMSLSSKFQANENSIASHFLFWVSSFQFTALFLSQAIFLYVRIYESKNPLSIAFKENADVRRLNSDF